MPTPHGRAWIAQRIARALNRIELERLWADLSDAYRADPETRERFKEKAKEWT